MTARRRVAAGLLLFLSACGGRAAPVAVPGPHAAPVPHDTLDAPGAPGSWGPSGALDASGRRAAPRSADEAATRRAGYFFRGLPFGSDQVVGPLGLLLNKGFATAQWEANGRKIFDYPYGWRAVWRSVSAPGHTVRDHGGWKAVLTWNFIPFTGEGLNSWQWYPNYFGHILEGGIAYRQLAEWFRYQGVPAPSWMAASLTYLTAIVNEAYEVRPYRPWVDEHGSANTMVDLYFFDPVSILLFSHDGAARFFSETLHANTWPHQAAIVANGGRLMNNGQQVVMKLPLFFTERASFFFKSGMGVQLGLAHHLSGGYDLSWGLGGEAWSQFIDPETRTERARIDVSAGMWLDRGGSLLAGIQWYRKTDRRFTLNVYPGVLPGPGSDLGFWVVVDTGGRPFLGLSYAKALGVGTGLRLGG